MVANLLYALGESIARYGTLTRRTVGAEDVPEDFDRASTAQEIGADMTLRTAQPNVLRTEYEESVPGSGIYDVPLTLLEGQSSNVFLDSEEHDGPAWTPTRASVDPDVVPGPDGYMVADKIVEDATPAASHYIQQTQFKSTAVQTWTVSRFVKENERRYCYITASDASGANFVQQRFDIQDGILGSNATGGAGWTFLRAGISEPDKFGFRRIYLTVETDASDRIRSDFNLLETLEGGGYDGDGTSGLFTYGAQAEELPSLSSYIPTTRYPLSPDVDGVWSWALTGAAGDIVESFDAPEYNVANPRLEVFCAGVDWDDTGGDALVGKYEFSPGNERQYRLTQGPSANTLRLTISTDGTATQNIDSTTMGLEPGAPQWVAAEYVAATGAWAFYLGGSDPQAPAWAQFDNGTGTPQAVNVGTASLEIGSNSGGQNRATGRFYRARVLDAVSLAVAFDADATDTTTHDPNRRTVFEKANGNKVESSALSAITVRSADDLRFDWLTAPEPSSWYWRGRLRSFAGTGENFLRIWELGADTNGPRIYWYLDPSQEGRLYMLYHGTNGGGLTTILIPGGWEFDDELEVLTTIDAQGQARHLAVYNGTTYTAADPAPDPLPAQWSSQDLWMGRSESGRHSNARHRAFKVVRGVYSVEFMRAL